VAIAHRPGRPARGLVVGLYLDPPERAVVFSFDEKTQVQALDRTQPSLPMRPGRGGTMTHDYKRHGTTDLFAALNVATGEVLYDCRKRHTGKDVLAFFRLIDLHVPRELGVQSCWTTSRRTWDPRSPAGSTTPSEPAGTCTSHPPVRLGSTSSSGGSKRSPISLDDRLWAWFPSFPNAADGHACRSNTGTAGRAHAVGPLKSPTAASTAPDSAFGAVSSCPSPPPAGARGNRRC
jgi:hypothetical protein